MRKIIIPTDFSENASNAIRYAVRLFEEMECTFYLLHTFTPAAYNVATLADSYSALQMQEISRKNAEEGMERIISDVEKEFGNTKHFFERVVSFNLLVMEILDLIETKNIELIVMGTQGATGAKEVFIGTNTTQTLKKANIPVLAVPSSYGYEPPRDILFPTDYAFDKSNRYLPWLKELCGAHHAELHILNAYSGEPLSPEKKEVQQFLNDYFNNTPHEFHIEEDTDVLGAISEYEKKARFNLLVMIHNKHTFFENLLFKPVINQVAYHTQVPFLVLPAQ
ncbi:MAG: universal stress protein, UspA family [Flavobacteriaceae bacterium]|nr:universal stress protein, UspA family [Flavobacteriaceae bacterium]